MLARQPKSAKATWSLNPFLAWLKANQIINRYNMSEQDIPVSPDFQPAPGVKYEDETPAEQPQDPVKEPETAPESSEAPKEPETPAEPKAEAEPVKERPKKAGPIADLLEKKHNLETELETERKARIDLEAKITELSKKPDNKQTDLDIKGLAEKYELNEEFVEEMVSLARKGLNPQLPKEVQDLIHERNAERQHQAEMTAFDGRVQKLKGVFKDEPLDDPKVREKLLKLAYSTDKAPDGEPYYQKELSELYFGFIRPEIEPGKTSAEPSQGGTQASKVIDFEEIAKRDDPKEFEAMDDETFKKFNEWQAKQSGRTPLRRL